MTPEQVQEKFDATLLRFSHYYKYTFTFTGRTDDGYKVTCWYGGSSDEIYRYDVDAEREYLFGDLDGWSSVRIEDSEGKEVFYQNNEW